MNSDENTKQISKQKEIKEIKEKYQIMNEQEKIETCIPLIDNLLGGGFTKGSITQLVSDTSCGRTTILLNIAKRLIKYGQRVLFIDSDGAVSSDRLLNMGITEDDSFELYKANTFEDVEEIIDVMTDNELIDVIIIDSISSIINKAYIGNGKKGISITNAGSQHNSRPLSLFMTKYNAVVTKNKLIFIFSNQYRTHINFNQSTSIKEYGCKAVAYHTNNLLQLKQVKDKKKIKNYIFFESRIEPKSKIFLLELVKSDNGVPREYLYNFIYGKGIDPVFSIFLALLELKTIQVKGTYYSIELSNTDIINENGMENFIEKFSEKLVTIYEKYKDTIISYYKN